MIISTMSIAIKPFGIPVDLIIFKLLSPISSNIAF